jgi:hypothetical protein
MMRGRLFGAAVAAAAALTLGSCASPAYDEATRDGLRQHVLTVAEASAAGDWAGAVEGLDAMAVELSQARDEGRIGEERFDTIRLAMEVVRQDLDDAIAAAADEAERQRLLEEQARLQEQIAQLQEQQKNGDDGRGGNDDDEKGDDKKGEGGKKDD